MTQSYVKNDTVLRQQINDAVLRQQMTPRVQLTSVNYGNAITVSKLPVYRGAECAPVVVDPPDEAVNGRSIFPIHAPWAGGYDPAVRVAPDRDQINEVPRCDQAHGGAVCRWSGDDEILDLGCEKRNRGQVRDRDS